MLQPVCLDRIPMDNPSELAFIPVPPPKKVLESVVTTDSTIVPGVAIDPGRAWRGIPVTLQIRTAAELVDPELEARWTTRRAARETESYKPSCERSSSGLTRSWLRSSSGPSPSKPQTRLER